jgi:predicted nucleotidyltransferase
MMKTKAAVVGFSDGRLFCGPDCDAGNWIVRKTRKVDCLFLANPLGIWYKEAMGKQEIIDIIKSSKPDLEARYGVKRVGLFGSYVRNRQRKKSDIDLLVTFDREIDLFDFLDLREFLEIRLHHKVDLVMESALKPAIGRRILAEVEYV